MAEGQPLRDDRSGLTRRRFLVVATAASALLRLPRALAAGGLGVKFADGEGVSLGRGVTAYDLETLASWITPTSSFFVRDHFGVPASRPERFVIRGEVKKPSYFSLDDLRGLERRESVLTLECAGNSVAQKQGLVGNARWGGAALGALLDRVGPVDPAHHAWFIGADRPPGGIVGEPYTRSLPVAEALAREALLAWEMNGQPLPAEHGAPLRLVVPDWYGMASVKWLARIEIRSEPYTGSFQTRAYTNLVPGENAEWLHEPVTRVGLKSVIAAAAPIAGGIRLRGAAWGGERPIARVALTFDLGKTWKDATLERDHAPGAWRLWRYDWRGVAPGTHDVACRAFDDRGGEQPLRREARLSQAAYGRNEIVARRLAVTEARP